MHLTQPRFRTCNFFEFRLVLLQWLTGIFVMMGLFACEGRKAVQQTPLPASQQGLALNRFEPVEALDKIEEWYPGDWRLHLFRALTDSSPIGRLKSLQRADSLKPNEPILAYHLSLVYLEQDSASEEKRARPYLEKALALDPNNGVLRVMLAYVLLQGGELPKARALFMDPRRSLGGDFYYPRMEELLLGLFSYTSHLNPYTVTEAVEIYRRIPFPPFEKFINILYSVFLAPLPEHPYDIRIRGRDAARGLFQLGKKLRVQSYSGPKVLSSGYEQQVLGFMFQLKAAEFQTLFYQTFEDSVGADRAFQDLVQVQQEYEAFQAGQPWRDSTCELYLDKWSQLIQAKPLMTLSQAVDEASTWGLWKKTRIFRYPSLDDPP
jgi:Tetratricopeptide repeat